jgi:hypothetical protein
MKAKEISYRRGKHRHQLASAAWRSIGRGMRRRGSRRRQRNRRRLSIKTRRQSGVISGVVGKAGGSGSSIACRDASRRHTANRQANTAAANEKKN